MYILKQKFEEEADFEHLPLAAGTEGYRSQYPLAEA
jgi:hypothetical protein